MTRTAPPDRHTGKAHLSRLFHPHLRLWLAHHRGGHAARFRGRLEADGPARHRQAKQGAYSPADRIDPPDAPRGLENPSQPAVALSQSAADDPLARCDRTGRVHPDAQRLRLQRRFPAALAASQLRHAHAPAGRGHPDHPDLARPFEPAIHGDLHPPDEPLRDQLRTLLCQTTDGLFEGRRPAVVDHRVRPPKAASSWRTSSAVRSPIHFSIRPPDDALAEEGTFGHRRLLHARAGGTALPLRRLPRHVLALPLLPEPGMPQMPRNPGPAVARRASSRAVAVRLFSRRRDRALAVARCSVATRSCCTAC